MHWVRGFTIVETMIVLVLTLIILFVVVGNFSQFFYGSIVDGEVQSLVSMLRLAKGKSVSEVNDKAYQVVLTGTSFALQTEAGEVVETHLMNSQARITANTTGTIVFNKNTGVASTRCPTGCTITISFYPNTSFAAKNVLVSSQGLISIQ